MFEERIERHHVLFLHARMVKRRDESSYNLWRRRAIHTAIKLIDSCTSLVHNLASPVGRGSRNGSAQAQCAAPGRFSVLTTSL